MGKKQTTMLIREALKSSGHDAKTIFNKIVALAMEGNTQLLIFIGERLFPPLKAVDSPQPFQLPMPDQPITNLQQLASHLVHAVASGQITPDTADRIGRLITVMSRIPEPDSFDNFAKRLEALEQSASAKAIDIEPSQPSASIKPRPPPIDDTRIKPRRGIASRRGGNHAVQEIPNAKAGNPRPDREA
jgi:hypothetical protein